MKPPQWLIPITSKKFAESTKLKLPQNENTGYRLVCTNLLELSISIFAGILGKANSGVKSGAAAASPGGKNVVQIDLCKGIFREIAAVSVRFTTTTTVVAARIIIVRLLNQFPFPLLVFPQNTFALTINLYYFPVRMLLVEVFILILIVLVFVLVVFLFVVLFFVVVFLIDLGLRTVFASRGVFRSLLFPVIGNVLFVCAGEFRFPLRRDSVCIMLLLLLFLLLLLYFFVFVLLILPLHRLILLLLSNYLRLSSSSSKICRVLGGVF